MSLLLTAGHQMYFQWLLLLRYKNWLKFMSEITWNRHWIKTWFTSCNELTVETYLSYLGVTISSYFPWSWACFIWRSKSHWLDNFLIYTITGRNIVFLVPLLYVTCWAFGKRVLNPVYHQKGQSRDNCIISLFNSKCKRWWINLLFLQDKHNINTVS